MENSNEATIIFDSRPENEGLARVTAAAFCTQLNPTLEEVADLKTAVSEAVTNCIIHGYKGEIHKIRMKCRLKENTIYLDIEDDGVGMPSEVVARLLTAPAGKSGIGVKNVHERIRLTYGEPYGIQVRSVEDEGTCVTIRLPRRKGGGAA